MAEKELLSRQEAIAELKTSLENLKYMSDQPTYKAVVTAIKSMELWDGFLAKLAEKCNAAHCAEEWNFYHRAIAVIKSEFEEEIK